MGANEMILSWRNLNLTVTNKPKKFFGKQHRQKLYLLNNVSGYAKSGSLLGIMGPSGAGKTTLLAAISQRNCGDITGDIHLNGRAVDKDLMMRISGFVPQQDLAITCLTVTEHLNFMATLKMDRRVQKMRRQRIVARLIQDLNLCNSCSTVLSSLSGGERKRLSLAVQMITDPPLLFCDEPTTGLDSYSACTVVTILRHLTDRGKAVICTIHQPSSEVFFLFDRLCLLAPGGRLAYHGDSALAKTHFERMGLTIPPTYNPADFYLAQLGSQSKTNNICDYFERSTLNEELRKELDCIKYSADNGTHIFGIERKFLKYYSMQPPTKATQLKWLIWRSVLAMFRDSHKLFLRLAIYIMTALIISSPYIGIKLNQDGIQNYQGFHYAMISETIFCQAYAVIHTFPSEIPVLLREIGNKVYQPGPYYFSKIMTLLPRVILETLLFCVITFYTVGINGGSSGFLVFSSPVLASAVASSAYGCFISALFENIATASVLSVPVDIVSYIFSGLFLQLSTVPVYLSWIKYISRFYYGVEAMSILQWNNIDNIPCSENADIPCVSSGIKVLEKYGFSPNNLRLDFIGLFTIFILLHLFGFLALWKRSRQQSVY